MKNTLVLVGLVFVAFARAQVESLPAPIVNANSFEIISNSRYSVHSGFTSSLSNQILSNVLWVMNRTPVLGSYREFYIATPSNVYRYDSAGNTLVVHLAGNHRFSSGSAFEVGIATERNEEAGMAIQAGLLAATAFRTFSGGNVVCCPMQFATNYANSNWNPVHPIMMVNVYGQMTATRLTDSCRAISSDSTLPRPQVNGSDTFEVVVSRLQSDSVFDPANLTVPMLSQLCWAGYGVVPHNTTNGRVALTVASAVGNYYLNGKVYVVRDTAVHRFWDRRPGGSLTTYDHRLELVTAGDRRPDLRTACPRLPGSAPLYFVICVADTSLNWSVLEAGFVASQLQMQTQVLGLRGWLTTPLTPVERSAIITALGIPGTDLPILVYSVGQLATAAREYVPPEPPVMTPMTTVVGRAPVRIEYNLSEPVQTHLAVFDLSGRIIRDLGQSLESAGRHFAEWNGLDSQGKPAPAGTYLLSIDRPDQPRGWVKILLTR